MLTYISTSKVVLDTIYNTYKRDLSDKVTYDKDVLRCKTKRVRAAKKPSGLMEAWKLSTVLSILLIMPMICLL